MLVTRRRRVKASNRHLTGDQGHHDVVYATRKRDHGQMLITSSPVTARAKLRELGIAV